MRHYRRRIGTRLQAHQFNIRSIGKTRQRHLGRMIRVRPAILGRNTHRRAEGLPHGRQSIYSCCDQSRLLYKAYQQEIAACDQEIEKLVSAFEPRVDPVQKPLPPDRKRNRNEQKKRKKRGLPKTEFDLRTEAYKLFGVDVTQIPGLEMSVLPLFSVRPLITPELT